MTEIKKLHYIVNNTHHTINVNREYILQKMEEDFQIPRDRTLILIDKCLKNKSLIENKFGFLSTMNPLIDNGNWLNRQIHKIRSLEGKNLIFIVAAFAGIIGFCFALYDRFFKN